LTKKNKILALSAEPSRKKGDGVDFFNFAN